MQFKMRQHQRKVTPNKAEQAVMTNGHANKNGGMQHSAAEWEEIEFEPVIRENERTSKSHSRRSFEIGVNRPSPGSVGKLKLSSEMRQRLEQVSFVLILLDLASPSKYRGRRTDSVFNR